MDGLITDKFVRNTGPVSFDMFGSEKPSAEMFIGMHFRISRNSGFCGYDPKIPILIVDGDSHPKKVPKNTLGGMRWMLKKSVSM